MSWESEVPPLASSGSELASAEKLPMGVPG